VKTELKKPKNSEKKVSISASILSGDFLAMGAAVQGMDAAGVDSFHLDVMDGHLVPNISFGPVLIQAIRRATERPLMVHLMIENPGLYLADYAAVGSDLVYLHAEAYQQEPVDVTTIRDQARYTTVIDTDQMQADLRRARDLGMGAAVVLNIHTPLAVIEPVVSACDAVLLMAVDPGFSNQAFMPAVVPKVSALRAIYDGVISVDGGVNATHAPDLIAAGASDLISASYLFGSANWGAAIQALRGNSV
jgi:ribulose-phosphate 3-epimerase